MLVADGGYMATKKNENVTKEQLEANRLAPSEADLSVMIDDSVHLDEIKALREQIQALEKTIAELKAAVAAAPVIELESLMPARSH